MSANSIGSGSANYNVQQQARARANSAGAGKTGGDYDQAGYLRELNDRLDANVVPGAWNGKDAFGAKKATAMIHPDFLRKMHDNPALGAEYEKAINDWAKTDADIRKRMEAQGNTITSLGMYVDKNGETNYHMAGTYTTGSDKPETAKATDKDGLKSEMEKMLERLKEKREKEKLEAEREAKADAAGELVDGSRAVDTIA